MHSDGECLHRLSAHIPLQQLQISLILAEECNDGINFPSAHLAQVDHLSGSEIHRVFHLKLSEPQAAHIQALPEATTILIRPMKASDIKHMVTFLCYKHRLRSGFGGGTDALEKCTGISGATASPVRIRLQHDRRYMCATFARGTCSPAGFFKGELEQ